MAVVVPVSLAATGVAAASILSAPPAASPAPSPPPGLMRSADVDDGPDDADTKGDPKRDAGIHGGPIERTHDAGACGLVGVGGLPGNWTHGDYVSAVAALGDPALVPIAAQSDCGKPAQAGGPSAQGGGPPEHAGGPPEHAGPPDVAAAPDTAGPPQGS